MIKSNILKIMLFLNNLNLLISLKLPIVARRASMCIQIMCIQGTSGTACMQNDRNNFNGQIFILFWGTPLFILFFFWLGWLTSFHFPKSPHNNPPWCQHRRQKKPGKPFFIQLNINIVLFHLLTPTFVFSFQPFFF